VTANGIPLGRKVIKVALWREQLKHRGLHSGDDAGRKWFERTRNRLISANKVAVSGEYLWSLA